MILNYRLGIFFALFSAFAYAVQTIVVNDANHVASTPVIVFLETIVALVSMLLYLTLFGKKKFNTYFVTHDYKIHLKRAIFRVGISYFLFLSLRYIPVVNAVLLSNLSPLIIPLISFLFFKGSLNLKLIPTILLGFVGVIFVLNPQGEFQLVGTGLAILSSFCIAISMIYVRSASKHDSSETITLYYLIFGTMITCLISLPFWSIISLHTLMVLITIGIIFFIVQLTLSLALKYSNPIIVGTLYYSNIIFSSLLVTILYKSKIESTTIIGIILISLGGIATTYIEKNIKRIEAGKFS